MRDQLYRAIFNAALDALVVVDDEQRFIEVNPSACDIFSLSREELLARRLLDFIEPAQQEETHQLWRQFREKEHLQGEITLRRADGTLINVEYRATADIAPHRHLSILRPLTERHQAQAVQAQLLAQLADHQSRLQGILTSIPGVVWEAWGKPDAASQRIDFVSDHIQMMLGYKVEEWLATPNFWLSIVHPEDREHAARIAAASFANGTGHIDEFRWRAKDGRALWVEARVVVIKDSDGNSVGMRGVTLDISERKKAQQALQLSEERFRFLFEQSPVSMQILEPGGKTIQVNGAWEKLWGLTLEQIKDYNILEDQQLAEKGTLPYLRRAFQGQATSLPEIYYDPGASLHIPNGRARWTRPIAYPLYNEDHVSEVVLIHEDITDWKLAERNLQFLLEASRVLSSSLDYEETLKNLAEFAVPDFADYCEIDMLEDNSIKRVALTHRSPEKIPVIEEIDRKFPPDLEAPAGVARVLRTGKAEMASVIPDELFEASMQNQEHLALFRQLNFKSYICVPLKVRGQTVGTISWVRAGNSAPYEAADFELTRDLGHRAGIAIENALLYRNATTALVTAEAANRAKDEFLAVVSHELRTPLNAISGWASLLRHDALDETTRAQALEVIERNCFIQGRLVEDILEVSRIVGGNLKLEKKPLDLASIVDESITAVNASAAAKSIQLEPNLERPVFIDGDEVRLQQVVTNLLSNAIKFTGQSGRVSISLNTCAAWAEIQVADNGQGIPGAFLPHVFDHFRQADGSSTRRYGGLGLGLAIVRHLIESHGGTVQAQSPGEGKGATFTVKLPLLSPTLHGSADTQPLIATGAVVEGAKDSDQRQGKLSGLEILVVDDEPDAVQLARLRLEAAGATVVTAQSARVALQALQARDFSLLISDVAMPGESGYTLIQQVRTLENRNKAGIPAIALTALAGPEEKERALAAGFQLHLEKPISFEELIQEIVQLCRPES